MVTYKGGIPAQKWSPIPVLSGLSVEYLRTNCTSVKAATINQSTLYCVSKYVHHPTTSDNFYSSCPIAVIFIQIFTSPF